MSYIIFGYISAQYIYVCICACKYVKLAYNLFIYTNARTDNKTPHLLGNSISSIILMLTLYSL